jgi:GNAT superfamily N-acetyltransferase
VVAVTVGSAGQVGPAASLIACWRARWPWITWLAVGERPWTDHVNAVLSLHIPEDLSPQFDGIWSPGTAGATKRLERPLHADVLQTILEDASAKNIRFLVWHDRRGELKSISGGLYTAASQGIWNHLILPEPQTSGQDEDLGRFAEKNPTIVHSWCLRSHPSLFSDPLDIYPSESPPYKDTKPLPGVPLWQILRCPMDLCAALQHVKNKTLQRLRFDRAEGTIWEIGQNLIYHYLEPSALPDACLDEICRMVQAGGSVGVTWLRHNLERAFLIAYVEEKEMIVGCSSLKYPRKEYIQAVSAQSGIDLNGFLERGYTSVRPEYRGMGIGAKLLEELTIRAQSYKIFSIIAEDNRATQKMAMRTGTCRVAIFYSERAGKHVGVWIPEWMLPKNLHLPPQPDFEHQPDGLRP